MSDVDTILGSKSRAYMQTKALMNESWVFRNLNFSTSFYQFINILVNRNYTLKEINIKNNAIKLTCHRVK